MTETTSPNPPLLRDLPARNRPRERLLEVGAKALSTPELLAILLRTGSGGENVLRLAERLLIHFQSLPRLATATITEITAVHGIGQVKAIELKAAFELGRRLLTADPLERPVITSPATAAELLMADMMFLEREELRLILLDTRHRVIAMPVVYRGSLNSSVVRVGELFRAAMRENAAGLIVVHNHPSGDPSPSREDIRVTRRIVAAGKLLDLDLLDHIIIGRQRFVSLKERGLGFEEPLNDLFDNLAD